MWTLFLELTFLFVVPVVSWPPRCGGHCGKMEEGAQSSPDQDTTQTRRGVKAPKTAPNTSKRFFAVPMVSQCAMMEPINKYGHG